MWVSALPCASSFSLHCPHTLIVCFADERNATIRATQSICTAYHALSFTTLLLRRWLLYYSLLPSIIRLIALQSICWPLVRLTLYILGPNQPVGAWVIIATTTAFSDTVARWVTSNIADAEMGGGGEGQEGKGRGSGRGTGRGEQGRWFWRAVIGGPGESAGGTAGTATDDTWLEREGANDEHQSQSRHLQPHSHSHPRLSSVLTRRRARKRNGQAQTQAQTGGETSADELGHEHDELMDGGVSDTDVGGSVSALGSGSRRWRRSRGSGSGSATATAPGEKDTRRRVFHWDVAMRRNVLPIALLSYVTMWILLLDAM